VHFVLGLKPAHCKTYSLSPLSLSHTHTHTHTHAYTIEGLDPFGSRKNRIWYNKNNYDVNIFFVF